MSAAPKSASSHRALIWIIRGSGALLAGIAALTLIYLLYSQVVEVLHGRTGSMGWVGMLIGTLVMVVITSFSVVIGCKIFREVNTKSVAEFSGMLAFIASIDFHYWWPLLYPQYSDAKDLAFFVFVFLFRPTKNILLHLLQLNPPSLPPEEPSTNIPEFPKRSPLVEL